MSYSYIVVDDEALIRKGLILRISKTSLNLNCVGEAENGIEGLKLIREKAPDIIITDMKMPSMDGIEFLQKIDEENIINQTIVLSSHSNIEYLKSAIKHRVVNYLLKPYSMDELVEALSLSVSRIESEKKLKNAAIELDDITRQQESDEYYLSLLLKDDFTAKPEDINQKVILITIITSAPIGLTILASTLEVYFKESFTIVHNRAKFYEIMILLFDPPLKVMQQALQEIMCVFSNQQIYISQSTCDDLHNARRLYLDNQVQFCSLKIKDKKAILSYDKEEAERVFSQTEIDSIFKKLLFSSENTNKIIESFFEEYEEVNAKFKTIYTECSYLINLVDQYAQRNNIPTDSVMERFYERYRFELDVNKIRRELGGYIRLILNSVKKDSGDHLIDEIKTHMRKNFNEKLTLETVSRDFYIHPNYLSQLFKNTTDENFSAYLSYLRLENAKELLCSTSLSISQITQKIGYSNSKYFHRIFKEFSGYTPNEYRKKY